MVAEPTAEADRGRHPGFSGFNVLAGGPGSLAVRYLPKYAPDTNPIERVSWRLHEAVTRNHRCQSMDELLDLTFDWFETRTHFRVRSAVYNNSP